jgi:hypothetical protein
MKGRIALAEGDSSLLKEVTEDSLFKLIMLRENFVRLVNIPTSNPNLNIYAKSIEIEEDCGTCQMTGLEFYQINICKDGEVWKVKGENGNYPTSEQIRKAELDIIEEKILIKNRPATDSIIRRLNNFFMSSTKYFETKDLTSLKELCDEPSLRFIKRLYNYAEQKTGIDKLNIEMKRPKSWGCNVSFESRKTTCLLQNDEATVSVQKKEGVYVITGFNGVASNDITKQMIKEQYPNLLYALGLIPSQRYRTKELF